MENAYIAYYSVQVGSGLKDLGPVYFNPRFIQQGRGFGNFFETIFRYLKPIFKSGMNAVKDSALRTGGDILKELGSRPLNEILADHGQKFTQDLGSKLGSKLKQKFQSGSGLMFTGIAKRKPKSKSIKGKRRTKKKQLKTKRKSSKTTVKKSKKKTKAKIKKSKQRILDIFER
jgi:hypothetical protein